MRLLALLCCAALPAQDPVLAPAEQAYREGDFARAHALLSAALDAEVAPRGDVLFHLGNSAFRLGQPAEALWHYRRARPHLPRDAELRANIAVVEARLGVGPPPATLGDALLAPLAKLTAGEQLALATVLQVLGVLAWLGLRGRRTARAAAFAAAAMGLALGLRVAAHSWSPRPSEAVVLHACALRAAPAAGAETVLTLRPGETLLVARDHGSWIEVTHALGTGFVERNAVGLLTGV